jgi:type II secretory pathway pseudopilin PulG
MRRNKGYIIIELIAAMFVLSVGFGIVCSVLVSSAAKLREFDNAVTAKIIAANHLAQLKHGVHEGTAPATGERLNAVSPMAERLPGFTGWGEVKDVRDGLKQIEVVVKWKERGGVRTVRLRSLVARVES